MKQTKTTLKELTAMYRAVLRHGILCNAIALGLIAATPAMAEDIVLNGIQFATTEGLNIGQAGDTVTITSTGDGLRAISTGTGANAQSKFANITADTINITSTSGGGDAGLWIQNNTIPEDGATTFSTVNLTANDINISGPSGVVVMSQGRLNIDGNTTITGGVDHDAILTRGFAQTKINQSGENTVKLTGNIDFNFDKDSSGTPIDALVDITLNGAESYWTGNTVVSYDDGVPPAEASYMDVSDATITLKNGATWNATKITDQVDYYHTALNNLNSDGGVVHANEAGAQMNVEKLTVGANGLTINGGELTVDNKLTSTGRTVVDEGAALTVNAANGATFTGSVTASDGGAILNSGTLTLNDASFLNNEARYGGAIENIGTGATAQLTVNGGSFENNSAKYGGAIDNDNAFSEINGAVFTGNSSTYNGGAIYAQSADITNTNFTGNSAGGKGGAILSNHALTITGGKFEGNHAGAAGVLYDNSLGETSHSVTINGTKFVDNYAGDFGAVAIFSADSSVTNATFTGNQATADYADLGDGAGALFLGSESQTVVSGSTFKENYSGTIGGAIATRPINYWLDTDYSGKGTNSSVNGKVDILSSTFEDNEAGTRGGALFNSFYNSANKEGSAYVYDSTFKNNTADLGGAIYNEGWQDASGNYANIYIGKSAFDLNTAAKGGVFYNDENATATLDDSQFTGNTATDKGGALYNAGIMNVVANGTDVTFSGNKANGVDNDIYNAGTLTLTAANGKTISLAGGIDGAAGTLNINGAGSVEVANTLMNQTTILSNGELHLNNVDLTGSTVAVAGGATINTIDDLINDYSSNINLDNGALIKGDIDFLAGTADKYAATNGATVKYKVGNLISDIGKGTKDIQVVSDGAKVDISEATWTSTNGAAFVSSDAFDGMMKVRGFEGGITEAADATAGAAGDGSDGVQETKYQLTENETVGTASSFYNNVKLTGDGVEDGDKGVTLNADLTAEENANVEISELKLAGTGKYVNNALTRIKNSRIDVNVDNYGTWESDPTTYSGTVNNYAGSIASFDEDTFESTATLANAGNAILMRGVTFDSGAAITGSGTTTLAAGLTHFNDTANGNTVAVARGALFDGTIVNSGTVDTRNGGIDAGLGTVTGGDVYVDADYVANKIDMFATGRAVNKINLINSEYGDAASKVLDLGGNTLASGATFSGGYYTKMTDNGTSVTFSDKLMNTSGMHAQLGNWSAANFIGDSTEYVAATDSYSTTQGQTVGQALTALDTAIGNMSGFGSQNYAKNTTNVAANITALDTQVKTNTDAISDINASDPMTSGITAAKVSTYDGYATTIAGKADAATTLAGYGITDAYTQTQVDTKLADKQDNLTTAQLAAANSGITATKVGTYDDVAAAVNHATTGLAATKAIADANAAAIATHGNIVTHNVAEFATSGQGAKADTAIQGVQVNGADLTPNASNIVNVTVASGSANGTIAVNGVDVAVTGLGTAAYEAATAFDAAGSAAAVDAKLGTGFSSTDTVAAALALKQDAISDTATIAAYGTGFSVVDGSIGTTQLSTAVNASLGAADSAIQGVKVNGTALTPDAGNVVDITMTETADAGALHTAIAGIMGGSDSAKDKRTALAGLLTTGTYAGQNLTSASTAEAVASYMQLTADVMSEYDFGWDLNTGLLHDKVGGKYKIDVLNDTGVTDITVAGAINANTAAMTVASDGNYITAGHDVAANLGALDTQAKANADDIADIVSGATIVAKAYGDEDGNNIKATYATKTEVTTGVTAVYNQAHNWAENLLGLDVDENVEDQLQHGLAALGGTNNIAADTITGALHELDTEKAGLGTDNTFTGGNTFQNANGINIANAGGTITANMKAGIYDGHNVLAISGVDGVTAGAFVATGDGFMTEHFTANDTEIELTNGSDAVMFSVDNTGDMTVAGDASIGGDLNVTGDTTLTGLLTANGGITTTTLTTSGDASVGGDLDVTGATTLTGLLTANGGISTTTLTTTGDATVGGALAVTGDTALTGDLAVTGDTTLTTLNATGAVDFDSTLNVDGATTLGSTLAVTGNTTVGGTLGVNGATLTGSTTALTSDKKVVSANGFEVSGTTSLLDNNFTLNSKSVTDIDAGAGIARSTAGSATTLATTSSVVGTIANQAQDATYTNTITTGSNVTGTTLNTAIANLDSAIGNMASLSARDDANSVGNALANGGTTTPTTVVAALNNIDATLGTVHNLSGKLTTAGTYKGNLASGTTTTVEDHLVAVDTAIGDRSSLASLNTAINAAAATDVATALETTGNLIGDMNFAGTNYLATVTDMSEAVRVLDSNITKIDHKVEKLERKVNSGMASMAALTALVPNARDCGDTQVSVGTGVYADRAGIAMGAFHYFNDHVLFNAGASYGGTRDWAFRAGITFGL